MLWVDAAPLLRRARRRARLTQRQLAARAGTSHSTLAAYEAGHKIPTVSTLVRIVAAAGFEVRAELRHRGPFADRRARGEELVEVLDLADALPAVHGDGRGGPVFGRA
jgi:transcriptional regulator with XRE-family HTH domain